MFILPKCVLNYGGLLERMVHNATRLGSLLSSDILHVIYATRSLKYSSEILVHADMIA